MKNFLVLLLCCVGVMMLGCQSSENPSAPMVASMTVSEGPSNITVGGKPAPAVANPSTLWPPNQKMVTVVFEGSVTSAGSYELTDEYGELTYSGQLQLGSGGTYSVELDLKAARNGNDKTGRIYTFTVTTPGGSASTLVVCPHNGGN